LFALIALAYVVTTPPTFTAASKLLIDLGRSQVLPQTGGRSENDLAELRVESQVEILQSDRIASRVIRDLKLLSDPEFAALSPSAIDNLLDFVRSQQPKAELVGNSEEDELRARYVEAVFASRLYVRRVGRSFILEIAFRSSDPEKAARIANAVALAYITEDLEAKSAAATRGSNWLQERLASLREQVYDAAQAVERFKSVGGSGSPSDAAVELAELESVSQTYRRAYEVYLQKFTETTQAISYPVSDARIVSAAAVPFAKNHPKAIPLLAFAVVLGAGLGTSAHLVRRALGRRVQSPDQIENETGLECIGAVRNIDTAGMWRRLLGLQRRSPLSSSKLLPPDPRLLRDMRPTKASLGAAMFGKKSWCLGVVSINSSGGATTLACHLGALYALSGDSTVLVDANSEYPSLSRSLAPDSEFGLIDAIANPNILQRLFVTQPIPCLSVLPGGFGENQSILSYKLGSDQMALQIEGLRQMFCTTIIDLPDLSGSADAKAIAPYLDGIVLVATYNETTIDELTEAITSITRARGDILGVVINRVPAKGHK
jgi:Mrp family chromosome partitioning ATPase/capsular polysaccharide biosynthesis protein